MKTVLGQIGSGKTTEIIKESAKNGYYIICADQARIRYVLNLAKTLGLNIPCPATFSELLSGRFGRGRDRPGILIDDADSLLNNLVNQAGCQLKGFSCTLESYTPPPGGLSELQPLHGSQSLWIVRSLVDGSYVYTSSYCSWISASEVKSKVWFKHLEGGGCKDKTADRIMAEHGWEIVRVDFTDDAAIRV